jgi:hypothetical protein
MSGPAPPAAPKPEGLDLAKHGPAAAGRGLGALGAYALLRRKNDRE